MKVPWGFMIRVKVHRVEDAVPKTKLSAQGDKTMKKIWLVLMGVMAFGLTLLGAEKDFAAEKYPTKPINVIIAFQPGDTDINLRPFIEKMPEYLGQPMTFMYKPGAGGALGAGIVVSSKPDGYNILGSTQSAMVILPLTQKNVTYTLESFAPICCLCESYSMLLVKSNARWKKLPELVAEAQKEPGKISFTSPGTLAIQHLLVEAFSKEARIKLNHIPAQGSGPAVTALLGGHVDMAVGSLTTAMPHIQAGTIRPIGIFARKRIKALPDSPTVSEQGYAVATTLIYGLVGPKGTPKEVIDAISSAARRVAEKDRSLLLERYGKLGVELLFQGPEEYGAALQNQHVFFEKVVKDVAK